MTHPSHTSRTRPHAARPTRRPITRSRSHAGFSLMELLVVVGLIAGLAALGSFAYLGFRSNAKQSSTTAILQEAQGVATEYQATTGEQIDPSDSTVGWPAGADTTIERFVWQAQQVDETERLLRNLNAQLRVLDATDNIYRPAEPDEVAEVIVDAWDKPLKYFQSTTSADFGEGVPAHHRPFFASAGADGKWGSYTANGPNAAAQDNLFSFNLD